MRYGLCTNGCEPLFLKDPLLITELELLPDLFVALILRENKKYDHTFDPKPK